MGNVVLNKLATASNAVIPYTPDRAINGSVEPTSRWVSNTVPAYLSVNLGGSYCINRWVVKHMGCVNGWNQSNYMLSDYRLQGSNNNVNWTDIDIVSSNTQVQTDRTFTPCVYSYVRLYVTNGLRANLGVASIMELEVYEVPESSLLANLSISQGSLAPAFTSNTKTYNANLGGDVNSITVTPTLLDPKATMTINGVTALSGAPSVPISINMGTNPAIQIVVTSSITKTVSTYTITPVKTSAYLSNLVLSNGNQIVPAFSRAQYDYTATVVDANITVTPTAEDTQAAIKVNGTSTSSGQPSTDIPLVMGANVVKVDVTAASGIKTYGVAVTRKQNLYLDKVDLSFAGRGVTDNKIIDMNRQDQNYAVTTKPKVATVVVSPYAEDATVSISVNGQVVASGSATIPITMSGATTVLNLIVSKAGVAESRNYQIAITM